MICTVCRYMRVQRSKYGIIGDEYIRKFKEGYVISET